MKGCSNILADDQFEIGMEERRGGASVLSCGARIDRILLSLKYRK